MSIVSGLARLVIVAGVASVVGHVAGATAGGNEKIARVYNLPRFKDVKKGVQNERT